MRTDITVNVDLPTWTVHKSSHFEGVWIRHETCGRSFGFTRDYPTLEDIMRTVVAHNCDKAMPDNNPYSEPVYPAGNDVRA